MIDVECYYNEAEVTEEEEELSLPELFKNSHSSFLPPTAANIVCSMIRTKYNIDIFTDNTDVFYNKDLEDQYVTVINHKYGTSMVYMPTEDNTGYSGIYEYATVPLFVPKSASKQQSRAKMHAIFVDCLGKAVGRILEIHTEEFGFSANCSPVFLFPQENYYEYVSLKDGAFVTNVEATIYVISPTSLPNVIWNISIYFEGESEEETVIGPGVGAVDEIYELIKMLAGLK